MFLPKIYIAFTVLKNCGHVYSIGTTEIWPGACYLLAAWWQNLRPVITYCRSKPSLKIRTASAIFWDHLGMFRDYGQKMYFLGIKLFCFSR